jgi:predicted anti-sigma-YlaC factor YlaD
VNGHPDPRRLIAGDDLPPVDRERLLEHLRDCAACRADLAYEDPSALFALLGLEPVPEGILDDVSRRANEAIDLASARPSRGRLLALGSLAAAVLIAGLLGIRWMGDTAGPAPAPVRVEARQPAIAIETVPAIPASIELLQSPGKAELVELLVGDVQIVMIFDEAMDI